MRYGMMIELEKCVGCMACVSACKEQWDTGPGASRDWVYTYEHGRRGENLGITFYPGLCMHCEDHPCTRDCPTGATYRNEKGVVVVNPEVCIGCGNCVSGCAYGARSYDLRRPGRSRGRPREADPAIRSEAARYRRGEPGSQGLLFR